MSAHGTDARDSDQALADVSSHKMVVAQVVDGAKGFGRLNIDHFAKIIRASSR